MTDVVCAFFSLFKSSTAFKELDDAEKRLEIMKNNQRFNPTQKEKKRWKIERESAKSIDLWLKNQNLPKINLTPVGGEDD